MRIGCMLDECEEKICCLSCERFGQDCTCAHLENHVFKTEEDVLEKCEESYIED